MVDEAPKYKLTLQIPVPGVIEVVCEGYLEEGAHEYLPRLEALVKQQTGPVAILYNTLPLTGYHYSFPMNHIGPFRTWLGKLRKVAVAHTIGTIGFAIATVSLASKAKIKGFPTREAALEWLAKD